MFDPIKSENRFKKGDDGEFVNFTKYEIARMLGSRALQIAMGAPLLIEMSEEDLKKIKYNPIEIAKKEFIQGQIPLTVKRPMPGSKKKKKKAEEEKKE